MNSKRKCTNCKEFFPAISMYRRGTSGVCTLDCEQELRRKSREKHDRRIERKAASREHKRVYSNTGASQETKRAVRARDGDMCRRCGTSFDLHVHHINYRSEGGSNAQQNLITLCNECHMWAHDNKRRHKPLLLAYIWLLYVEGKQLSLGEIGRMYGGPYQP